ncbi:7317_t:CDS:1, partial [Gigaspora margarita]
MSDYHITHNHPPADGATNSDPYYAYMDDTDSNNYCTPIPP